MAKRGFVAEVQNYCSKKKRKGGGNPGCGMDHEIKRKTLEGLLSKKIREEGNL